LEDTGWKAWAAQSEHSADFRPVAVVALNRTNIYVAANFYQALETGTLWWTVLNHWDGTSWSECTNGWIRGTVKTMAYYDGSIYVGGTITGVGWGPNEILAGNLGRYILSNHSWQADATGLRANEVNQIKVLSWYNGITTRTYIYTAGPTVVGNNIACSRIARAFYYSGFWNWETMNGGVSGLNLGELDITHVSIYPNYTHTVWVAGYFTRAGTGSGSVNTTNLAIWVEGSGGSGTWSAMGTAGRGLNHGTINPYDNCSVATFPFGADVYALANSDATLYIGGNFDMVNTTTFEPLGYCTGFAPIGMAKVTSLTTLGTWKNTAVGYQESGYNSYISSLAASGTNVYCALGPGGSTVGMGTGGITTSESLAKRYYEISGTGYFASIPASGTGFTNVSYDQVIAVNQNCVFFIGVDSSGADSICRYEYR
jgi:hypothetical protein